MKIRSKTFTPAQIEQICGLTPGQQRIWRARGHLPKKQDSRWTRANVADIARMWLTKVLGERGFSLRGAETAADNALPFVLHRLLALPGAVDVVTHRDGKVALTEAKMSPKRDGAQPLHFYYSFDAARGSSVPLIDALLDETGEKSEPLNRAARYLILASEGDEKQGAFSHIIAAASLVEVPDNLSVLMVLDHQRLAENLAARMENPLIELVSDAEDE